jgi:hypothetical protein
VVPGFVAGLAVLKALAAWPPGSRLAIAAVAMLVANSVGLLLATAALGRRAG